MERPLENFLRMNAAWGLPMPEAPLSLPPSPFQPSPPYGIGYNALFPPGFGPLAPPAPPAIAEPPAPAPAPAPVPAAAAAPAPIGYTPAAFEPPRMIARDRADVYGDYLATLGLRMPPAAEPSPLPPAPPPPPVRQPIQTTPTMPPPQAYARAEPPQPRVHPLLARRYPDATRMRALVDRARQRRGY